MGVLLSKKKNEKRQSFQVSAVPQDGDQTREEAAGPSDREDPTGKRRNEDDDSESQKSSEDEREPKIDGDDSENEEKDESKSDQEESASEDNEDQKNRSSSSASSKESKSSQEDEEKREGVEEEKDEEVEVKEGSVKDVVLAQTEVNLSYEKKVEKALVGDMDFEYPEKAKIVRIFTSSTFTDTSVERNTLMERVYPRLKSFCQERGYDFQVVDMRWGVRDESTDDHMTTELCMRELRACQKLSTGPNFITFLGQKYGYRPFPVKISSSEFEKLLGVVENQDDVALLKHWFWLDDNAVPAQYLLQPITSLLPHYRDYANEELRKKASVEWWTAFERMQVILRAAADNALEEAERHKYYMSVTEDEIRRGIITATEPGKHCFWFKRVITDLLQNAHDPNAGKFVDKPYGADNSAIDESAQKLLESLREKDLSAALPTKNVVQYDVKWTSEGISPEVSSEHAQYLEKLCADVYNVLTGMIQEAINEKEGDAREDSLNEEILQHALFCQKKGLACQGRDDFLQSVKSSLLERNDKRTVILHGESGCGKTSVLAKMAVEVRNWLEDDSAFVVLRFIGTSPESSSIRLLLRSVCQQLCKITNNDATQIPEEIMELLEFFPKCLEEACAFRPVVLILDSLDQLPADEGGRRLDWLPGKIPDDCYLIMSTLPGSEYECLPHLKNIFPERCFKEIPTIPLNEAAGILECWLRSSNRALIPSQKEVVLNAFRECPLPLYLKLSFDQAIRWKSYTPEDEATLASGVKNVINDFLEQVERRHGKILVSHALAYITASKNGLTEPELEDILSLDDEVLDDVYQYWTPPFRRLPPLLWIRIRSDIGDYLVERGADDSRVIFWYHRQFIELATDRYLGARPADVHSKLADYFLGKWSNGAEKPYIDKDGNTVLKDRLVAGQPLMFSNDEEKKTVFNLRKLNELPYHLLQASNLENLKKHALCNFEFLLAKLRATSLESILNDFTASLLLHPDDEDLVALEKTLQLSSAALKTDANQLAPQLLGRLIPLHNQAELTSISLLLQQTYSSSVPCLIPSDKCLTSPGGPLISSMKIPGKSVFKCCGFSCDGKTAYITSSFSQLLHIQILSVNLLNGKTLRRVTLPGSLGVGVVWVVQGSSINEDLLLLVGSTNIFLIKPSTGQVLQKLPALVKERMYNPMPPVSFVDNETSVIAITDQDIKIWTAENGKVAHKIDIGKIPTDEEYGTLGASGCRAVFSLHGSRSFTVLNCKTGERVREVNVFSGAGACFVGEIKVTSKEQVVVTSSEKNGLRLFDLHTGDFIREISQFKINKGLLRTHITADGTKAVSVADYEILVTNLEDGTVCKTLKSKSFGTLIIHVNFFTNDGKLAISLAQDDVIRIYNLQQALREGTEDVSKPSSYNKAVSSIDSINYLNTGTDARHVIATATVNNSNQIAIWDTLTGVMVRALKVFQELPPSTIRIYGASRAVGYIHDQEYLHFRVFDLKEGKVERNLQGKASKRTEAFGFIDENHIIAFSRGRRNLKVWSINDGKLTKQFKFGQKHRFEDMLISRSGRVVVCSQISPTVSHEEGTLPLFALNTQSGEHKVLEIENTQLMLWNGCLSDDGSYLVSLSKDFKALLWDFTNGTLKGNLVANEENPTAICTAISTASKVVLTGQGDGGITVWDIGNGRVRSTMECATVDSLFVAQDGKVAFSNYRYTNSNIDAWDLETGSKLATFTSDWKPERITISGNRLVVAKADKPELLMFRTHIPRSSEGTKPVDSPFKDCPLESVLQADQDLVHAREGDEDEDSEDDFDKTDFQKTEFTRKAVHAKPNVIIGGGSSVFASKSVFISEKVYRDNFM